MAFAQHSVIASEAKQSSLSFLGEMDCFASLAMTVSLRFALMPDPKNLPCFRGARDLAAGAAGACGDGLDQLAVRCHLGAIGLIERIFKPGAQVTAEFGAALMQRPDLRPTDRGDLPMGFRQFQPQED